MRFAWMLAVSSLAAGCTTHFTGAAKVKNGPAGCKATCEQWKMDLVGMVKMGEYSDGCICQVRPLLAPGHAPDATPAPAPPPPAPTSDASGPRQGSLSGLPAAAGVHLQMQAAAAAAAQQSAAHRRATEQHPYPHVPGSPPGSPGWRPGLP